ncbi:MAG: hypothetical protein IKJ65_05905 [Clostridia bacterium]|nr:hypothetical protein [Clostridia bacterium]
MARKNITYERLLRRDRGYKFYRFFLTIVLILAGIVFIRHVDSRLSEYEHNQPVNVIKRFIAHIEADAQSQSDEFASADEAFSAVLASIKAISNESSLSYRKISQSLIEEHHYHILAENEKIARVELKKQPLSKGENFNRWSVSSLSLVVSPERIAMNHLKNFQNGDFSFIIENTDALLYPAETKSDLQNYLLTSVKTDELTLTEGGASTEGQKTFMYLLGEETFFEISLKANSENADIWDLESCVPHFINATVYEADIPANATLYVNEAAALDTWIKSTYQSEHASRVCEDVQNPVDLTYKHYEIPFAFSEPNFSVKLDNGESVPFTLTDHKLSISSPAILPEFSFLEPTLKEATERIAKFFVGKTEIGNLTKYVEYRSSAYLVLYEYNLWKSLKAGSADMESFAITGMTKLGDNCVVAEISAMYRARYSDTNVIDYPLNYTLYLHTVKGKWLIYDFISK